MATHAGDISVPGRALAPVSVKLHNDPSSRPGQDGSFTPSRKIRFGSLEFTADSRGDLTPAKPLVPLKKSANPDVLTSGMETDDMRNLALDPDSIRTIGKTPAKHHPDTTPNNPGAATLRDSPTHLGSMDPVDLSSVNDLLGQIRAMGVSNGQSSVSD